VSIDQLSTSQLFGLLDFAPVSRLWHRESIAMGAAFSDGRSNADLRLESTVRVAPELQKPSKKLRKWRTSL
jgi:hypothetical protein